MNPAIENAFRAALSAIKDSVIPKAEELVAKVATQMATSIEDYIMSTINHFKSDIAYHDVEYLDKKTFMEYAKSSKCDEADGLAALIRFEADGKGGYIYLANVKNRDLIPMEYNKYVIIKFDLISAEIKVLWENCNLIILH